MGNWLYYYEYSTVTYYIYILELYKYFCVMLQGNHGEDVKEVYFYLDSTPSHSYMKALYKYPQRPFPYEDLILENTTRTKTDPEYELADTGLCG